MDEHQDRLSSLPKEALIHIVSFLSSKEVLQLSELNSSFGQDILPISVLHGPHLFMLRLSFDDEMDEDEQRNVTRRSMWIPVLFPQLTHSVVLTCDWHVDQRGQGNPEGKLFVVAVPAEDDSNKEALESIESGTIVHESPLAPDQEEPLTFSFSYCPTKSYYLWYRVVEGQANRFYVRNLQMHTIIHDRSGQWIGRNHQALRSQGYFGLGYNKASLQVLRTLAVLAQDKITPETAAHLTSLTDTTGVDVSSSSMKALEELVSALFENEAKQIVHQDLDEAERAKRETARATQAETNRVVTEAVQALLDNLQRIGADIEDMRHRPLLNPHLGANDDDNNDEIALEFLENDDGDNHDNGVLNLCFLLYFSLILSFGCMLFFCQQT